MKQTKVYITKESDGTYSSYMDNSSNLPYGLVGEGHSVNEAIDAWLRSYEDMRRLFEREGREFVEAKFSFTLDVQSMLMYYAGKLSLAGLSKITGVSAAQLSQYANGYRNPSPKTTTKIQKALNAFGTELSHLQLI